VFAVAAVGISDVIRHQQRFHKKRRRHDANDFVRYNVYSTCAGKREPRLICEKSETLVSILFYSH